MIYSNDDNDDNIDKDDEGLKVGISLEDLMKQIKEQGIEEEKEKKERKNIFSKFLAKFKKEEDAELREPLNEYSYEYSKFKEYMFLLEDTEDDDKVIQAIEICDDNLKLDRHRVYLNNKKKEYETILEDIKCYDNLSDEESEHLKKLINSFLQITTERRSLRYQMGDFNESINKLEVLEEDAYDALYQIEDAENSKRLLTRDIQIIKDEKERTVLDREKLQFAYKIINKFSFAIAIILGLAIVILTLVSISLNQSIFLPLSILCITLVFTIVIMYAFRKKIIFELKLNEKKHIKLVALLNKKTVVCSYYINFLNFAYNKYKVKNSRVLKENLKDFNNYKHITSRYDNLGKLVFEVQEQLETFLKEKNIKMANTSLESFAKSVNIDNKIAYFKEINAKKNKIENRIQEIDREHQEVWNKLVQLNLEDVSKEKVIEKIMKAYINETEKIILEESEIEKIDDEI